MTHKCPLFLVFITGTHLLQAAPQWFLNTRIDSIKGLESTSAELRVTHSPAPKNRMNPNGDTTSRYELWLQEAGKEPVLAYSPPPVRGKVYGAYNTDGFDGIVRVYDIWSDGNRILMAVQQPQSLKIIDLRKTDQWRFAGSLRINVFEGATALVTTLAFDQSGVLLGKNSAGQKINLRLAPDGILYFGDEVFHPAQVENPKPNPAHVAFWNTLPSTSNEWQRQFIASRSKYIAPRNEYGDEVIDNLENPTFKTWKARHLKTLAEVEIPPVTGYDGTLIHANLTHESPLLPQAPTPLPGIKNSPSRFLFPLATIAAISLFAFLLHRNKSKKV
jgi:hypothetical protein